MIYVQLLPEGRVTSGNRAFSSRLESRFSGKGSDLDDKDAGTER